MMSFTRSLTSVFRRQPQQVAPYTPPRNPVRGILVNGQMRSVAELRSDYGRGLRITMGSVGEMAAGDYSKEELATAYKTGVTAFIGVNVRCGISSEIPIHVTNEAGDECPGTPAQAFIDNAPKLIWRLLASSLVWGVMYIWKRRNANGYPSHLEVLSPLDVTPELDYSTNTIRRYRWQNGSTIRYIAPCDMIVDVTWNPFSDIDGTSALEIAKVRSDVETNIGRYGAMFFANSARPDLIITTDVDLDETQQQAARNSFNAQFKGIFNTFRAWFAGGANWKVQNISTNPVDLAMTELTNQADMKILAALRVNPILAGIGSAADPLSAQGTYEQVRRTHIDFVAIPDVRQLCNILNEQWLSVDFPGQTWRLEPDLSAIQSDSLGTGDRVTTATGAVTSHVWSVNEARAYTGKEPLPHVIGFNPDWASGMYTSGLLKQRQALLAVGYDPKTVNAPDEYHPVIEQAKTADLNSQLTSGAIMLNEWREAKGKPKLPNGNVFFIPAGSIQVPADKVGEMQPKPSYQPFGNPQVTPFEAAQLASGVVPPPPPEPIDTLPRSYARKLEEMYGQKSAYADIPQETLAHLHELGLWAKRVKNKGVQARFKAEVLPERVVTWVRSSLDDQWPAADVFGAAREWVRVGGNEPQLGATPEEYAAYWADYDGLQEDIREAWLKSYMGRVWEAVRPHIGANLSDTAIAQALAAHHDELVSEWLGTADKPGALLALVLAGMVAGEKSLQSGKAAKPQRAAAVVGIDWNLLSQQALDFAKTYAFDLIKNIDQTTIGLTRDAITKGITEGLSLDDITQQLIGVYGDENRARLIAQTESLNAYQMGAYERWQAAGATRAKWNTVNDSHVCPTCRSLNGQVADLATGWTDPQTGAVYRTLAHPGCRCPKVVVL